MKKRDQLLLEEAYKKVINEQDYIEGEDESQGSEIAVEIYLRREEERGIEPAKQAAYSSIKRELEATNKYAVEPYKNTLNNGSAVLELTVHTSSSWHEALDFDVPRIEEMLNRYEYKSVYMAGYPEEEV
jgi:hypothetical protein